MENSSLKIDLGGFCKLSLLFLFIILLTRTANSHNPCTTLADCVNITGNVTCQDEECVCSEEHVYIAKHMLCAPILYLEEHCQYTEQCLVRDSHTECMYGGNSETLQKTCRCAISYEKDYSSGEKKCITVSRITVYEKNAKILHFFGNGDSVPIIMSCLAAFLALFACFAGIFQFLRRKHNSRSSVRFGDPQHPQEVVTLNGSTPTQLPKLSDMSPSGLPDSLEFTPTSADGIQPSFQASLKHNGDLPPSYFEVFSHSQVIEEEEDEEQDEYRKNKDDDDMPKDNSGKGIIDLHSKEQVGE